MKPAAQLNQLGQSAWLDLIGRKLIHSGELLRMANEDGVRGVTANPSIFEKAIVESDEYDDQLKELIKRGKSPLEIYEAMAERDVRDACDALRPLFEKGQDGFVSLEVAPTIARDTQATVAEARRFWKSVDRPNLFIKIPANPEGIDAIRQATALGISVNVTLIFSVTVYARVIEAYLQGLEERVARGESVSQIRSVASFFVSRVDSAVDPLLPPGSQGQVAIANARKAYRLFQETLETPRWKALEAKGATRQRPLWASTGTKNKAYSDVHYVETLIGRDTVNTMPLATLKAFNDHGKVALTIEQPFEEVLQKAAAFIDLEAVCTKLTADGLDLFSQALSKLFKALEARKAAQGVRFEDRMGKRKDEARAALKVSKMPEHPGPRYLREQLSDLAAFAQSTGCQHALFLDDESGSFAAVEALTALFGKRSGGLDVKVIRQVRDVPFDLDQTLYVSGNTALESHYRKPGRKFVSLQRAGDYQRVFQLPADLHPLSAFNTPALLAAALLGLDLSELLQQAELAALTSLQQVPPKENLALRLGAYLARLPAKPTFLLSPNLRPMSEWLRRLCTGIEGVNPVVNEPAGKKDRYSDDRFFVSLAKESEAHDVGYLADAGLPLLQWQTQALYGELLRLETALLLARDLAGERHPRSQEVTQSEPSLRAGGLALFAAPEHALVLRKAAGTLGQAMAASPRGWIAAHLALVDKTDVLILHDQLEDSSLEEFQALLRDSLGLASSRAVILDRAPAESAVLQLTQGEASTVRIDGRPTLRVHAEDQPDNLFETLRDAVKLLSHK